MRRRGRPTPARCAYTLVELLIVLAVLAVLASLSWPAVRRMLGKAELRSGARQVKVALARARVGAMESGTAQVFRYQAGTGRFEVAPLFWPLDERRATARQASGRQLRARDPAAEELPRSVWFAEPGSWRGGQESPTTGSGLSETGSGVSERRRHMNADAATRLAPTPIAGDAGWSSPIVFFPNGRSTNARIRLDGSNGFRVEVALRGLTGTVQIGPLERVDERP